MNVVVQKITEALNILKSQVEMPRTDPRFDAAVAAGSLLYEACREAEKLKQALEASQNRSKELQDLLEKAIPYVEQGTEALESLGEIEDEDSVPARKFVEQCKKTLEKTSQDSETVSKMKADLETAAKEIRRLSVARIGDSERIGKMLCAKDKAEEELRKVLDSQNYDRLFPEVRTFAGQMLKELHANRGKGGWLDANTSNLLRRLHTEVKELEIEVCNWKNYKPVRSEKTRVERIVSEAADVANFAMMISDVVQRREKGATKRR